MVRGREGGKEGTAGFQRPFGQPSMPGTAVCGASAMQAVAWAEGMGLLLLLGLAHCEPLYALVSLMLPCTCFTVDTTAVSDKPQASNKQMTTVPTDCTEVDRDGKCVCVPVAMAVEYGWPGLSGMWDVSGASGGGGRLGCGRLVMCQEGSILPLHSNSAMVGPSKSPEALELCLAKSCPCSMQGSCTQAVA